MQNYKFWISFLPKYPPRFGSIVHNALVLGELLGKVHVDQLYFLKRSQTVLSKMSVDQLAKSATGQHQCVQCESSQSNEDVHVDLVSQRRLIFLKRVSDIFRIAIKNGNFIGEKF